jgi:Domain of unknown function (DUF4157)
MKPTASSTNVVAHTIGNQSKFRRLAQTVWSATEKEPGTGSGQSAGREDVTAREAPAGAAWDFSKISISPAERADRPRLPSPLAGTRRKLVVGRVDDPLEHEADRIADQVTRMSQPAKANPSHASTALGCQCTACAEEGEAIARMGAIGEAQQEGTAAPDIVHVVLASPGRSLDTNARGFFEPRFGQDLSKVRVHVDGRAAASARAVGARAYTVDHHIVFGNGQYQPNNATGLLLLAHELAHVTQQKSAGNKVVFRDKDEGKPQPSPANPQAPGPTPAAAPCIPKLNSMEAKITGTVGVREAEGRCQLILGTEKKANGATFTSKVDIPAGCTGTLQYVQLVDMCRGFHLTNGEDWRKKTGADWIDTHDPIDQQQVSSAGMVEFTSNDSPGQGLSPQFVSVHVSDSFKLWLLWKPDQPADANRVPIAMATWSWSADAKAAQPDSDDCAKTFTVTAHHATPGIGKPAKNFIAPTKTTGPNDPAPEKGKC